MIERPTVAIIGAGFSGLLTAVRLLVDPDGPKVRLIERRSAFARGAAYSTGDPKHLLNVRASNMSAFPEEPNHFCDWLGAQPGAEPQQGKSAFVSRRQYGDYLQAMLRQATERAPADRFVLDADAAVGLERVGARWRVTLAMGRAVSADAVVLAIGNLPPQTLGSVSEAALAAPGYITDPWSIAPDALPEHGEALLLGTGLTMIDVALHLARLRPGLRMLTLSRRGLVPRRHLTEGPAPMTWLKPETPTVLGLLRTMRAEARTQDWRAVIDGLRPHVRAIWRDWPMAERGRFLRHIRPWWDVHRHRLAPAIAAEFDHLTAAGLLALQAGSVKRIDLKDGRFECAFTPRGDKTARAMTADVVVNCTGPNTDLARADDPLVRGLIANGLIRADTCRLGLDVDAAGRLIGRAGVASDSLFAVGPITRGAFWEITSVPDIRVQAAETARAVSRALEPAES